VGDLHCDATLLLARHAEAEYDGPLVGDRGGSLTVRGRQQARALGESLRCSTCTSVRAALDTIEDTHPGKTVLVLSHSGTMVCAGPGLTAPAHAEVVRVGAQR